MAFLLRNAGLRRVLSTSSEFTSTVLPWRHHGFEVELVEGFEALLERPDGRDELRRRLAGADVFVTAHVQSYTGFRCDLEVLGSLCRETDTLFAVNATQSAGIFDIDVERDSIDLLGFTGFKWLMAGYGTGVLYVDRDRIDATRGPLVGWMSLHDPYADDLEEARLASDGRSLEAGVPDFSRVFALEAAVKALRNLGIAEVRSAVLDLAGLVASEAERRGLAVSSPRTGVHRSGIVILDLPRAVELQDQLAQRGVMVSARAGQLRVSPHFFNTREEVDQLFAILDELAAADPHAPR